MENSQSALEYRKLRRSYEYWIGSEYLGFASSVRHFRFITAFKKLIKIIKYKKYWYRPAYDSPDMKNIPVIKNDEPVSDRRIAVYTCITGNYDYIKEPLFKSDNVDFFVFSDRKVSSKAWKQLDIPKEAKSFTGSLVNRFIKMHPHLLFNNYDYTLYVDGNVLVLDNPLHFINCMNLEYGIAMHKHAFRNDIYKEADACLKLKKGNPIKIKAQLEAYRVEGMPDSYGLLEATIILTKMNHPKAAEIYDKWWDDFLIREGYRDQLSLPYVLWKMKINPNEIGTLGNNEYQNGSFFIFGH